MFLESKRQGIVSCLFCFVVLFCCFVLFCFVLFCFVLFCFVLFCFVLFFLNIMIYSRAGAALEVPAAVKKWLTLSMLLDGEIWYEYYSIYIILYFLFYLSYLVLSIFIFPHLSSSFLIFSNLFHLVLLIYFY